MTTALGIITSAMRKIGVLVKGEDPSADEADDGLEMLNDLLSSISNDSMVVYARTEDALTLSAGTATYTIGTGGTFNTSRPVKIISAYVRSGSIDYNLELINDEQYASITLKTTGSIPQFLNYTNGYPLGTLKFYPVPSAGYTLYLLSEKELSSVTLNQTISLPPGWKRMLIYNLAMDMAAEYGQPVTPEIKLIADESKAEIRKAIMTARSMAWETGIGSGGNIYGGWSR